MGSLPATVPEIHLVSGRLSHKWHRPRDRCGREPVPPVVGVRYNRATRWGLMAQTSDDTHADVLLLDRIAGRDASAVAELYDRQSRLLYGLIRRILRDQGEAEEVLQEVFLAVWTRAETYDVTLGSPVAWLVRIARNRAIDRVRARSVRDRTVDAYPLPVAAESPESGAVQREQQGAVTRALDALPAEQRALIEHAYFLGLTHSELAVRFRLPLGTVKTRIRTGMMPLRQQLQETVIKS